MGTGAGRTGPHRCGRSSQALQGLTLQLQALQVGHPPELRRYRARNTVEAQVQNAQIRQHSRPAPVAQPADQVIIAQVDGGDAAGRTLWTVAPRVARVQAADANPPSIHEARVSRSTLGCPPLVARPILAAQVGPSWWLL